MIIKVWYGDCNIDTQSDADGLAGYTSITGYLNIECQEDIDLSSLRDLISIGDYLRIAFNEKLTNLNGLHNITSVGKVLYISNNDVLTNLDGLIGIISIGGELTIWKNPTLMDLNGLCNLISVGKDIQINTNSKNIPYITDLASLQRFISLPSAVPTPSTIYLLGSPPAIPTYLQGHKVSGLKVGDRVKVLRTAKSNENGWGTSWASNMNQMVGNIYEIVEDAGMDGFRVLDTTINPSSPGYTFPYFVLQLEQTKTASKKPPYLIRHQACGLKVGDKVKITRIAASHEDGWMAFWPSGLDNTVGDTCIIENDYQTAGFKLNNGFAYPYFILQKEQQIPGVPSIISMATFNPAGLAVPEDQKYPHACPRCGKPAYIGLSTIDCSANCSEE